MPISGVGGGGGSSHSLCKDDKGIFWILQLFRAQNMGKIIML